MSMSKVDLKYCYLLKLAYDGTHYYGWQRQKQFDLTIQEILLKVFCQLTNSKNVKILGSSRTDRGVHALAQYCKVTLEKKIPVGKLKKSLECMLPLDIEVLEIEEISSEFRLMSSVYSKTYQYLFLPDSFKVSPASRQWVCPIPQKLDIQLLQEAASVFLGRHDFANFKVMGTETSTTIREIYRSEVMLLKEISSPLPFIPKGTLAYYVEGSGFLKQMVRMMIGAIVATAQGRVDISTLKLSLEKPIKNRLSAPLPAYGLTLVQTKFRD